jgi:uncharacterized protein
MLNHPKYMQLTEYLKNLTNAAIAFSGGVDSTFLTVAAKQTLGDSVIALTIATPYIARWEIHEAEELTKQFSVRHRIIEVAFPEAVRSNPGNRCYLCKKEAFTRLKRAAALLGFTHLLDGTNKDDLGDFRPGLQALKELDVKSPLAELGMTKEEVRMFSRELGLPTWNKPAYACLLTRLPFDHTVTEEEINRIEAAEKFLMDLGFHAVRVRSHGDIARIEINKELRKELLEDALARKVHDALRKIGFSYVTLDILGYQMGSFNRTIYDKNKDA